MALGLTADQIEWRVLTGRLHIVYNGVYAVGHPLQVRGGHLMAGSLACGPDAGASHRSAGALRWGLQDSRAVVDIIAPGRRGRSIKGIRAHACELHPEDRGLVDGIPCTSAPRTLLDMAADSNHGQMRNACRQCARFGELDLVAVKAVIDRVDRPRGVRTLVGVLEAWQPEALNAVNVTEERMFDLCDEAELPIPAVNRPLDIEGRRLIPDFLWDQHSVIAETDGGTDHTAPRSRIDDLERERILTRAGYKVRRFKRDQVTYEPEYVAATMRTILSAAEARDIGRRVAESME